MRKSMITIMHRVNTIRELLSVPPSRGVEVDVRSVRGTLMLSHDCITDPEKHDALDAYLSRFHHAFIVFDVKDAGCEKHIIELAERRGIENYFLLDTEFPFIYAATRKTGFRKIAVRYSEAEPIELALAQSGKNGPLLDWVWIDTNTSLPIDREVAAKLRRFRTCLVCPSRWGRPGDIRPYMESMRKAGFRPDAVMTEERHAAAWEEGSADG